MEIKSLFTYKHKEVRSFIEEPDMCVPNQSQSIPDLIARYTAGVPLPEKQPLYFGDRLPVEVSGQSYDVFDVLQEKQQVDIDYKKLYEDFLDRSRQMSMKFEENNNQVPQSVEPGETK